jgi:fucose 4-O-acetylase-like acetyltransferase
MPYSSFLIKKGKELLIPYFFFGILSYLFWVTVLRHYGMHASLIQVDPLHPVIGMFYGIGVGHWLIHNIPLWFLPCLFLTHALFYWIARCNSKSIKTLLIPLSSVTGYLITHYLSFRLPWSLEIALISVIFYGTGYFLQYFSWFPEKLKTPHILPVLIPCVFIHLIVIKYNTNVDINAGRFGNLFLFYAGAFVGILFWVIIAMFLPYLSIISQIGKNTLVIFSLHMRVFSVLTAIAVFILEIPVNYLEDSMTGAVFYTVITIGILLPVGRWISFYLPWILGRSLRYSV